MPGGTTTSFFHFPQGRCAEALTLRGACLPNSEEACPHLPPPASIRCTRTVSSDQFSKGKKLDTGSLRMNVFRTALLLLLFAALPALAKAQALRDSGGRSSSAAGATLARPRGTYTRPTEKLKLRNYFLDVIGPYPLLGAAAAAGINQADHTPPEWKQGSEGYSRRFGSDFGVAAVATTTRYGLARAFGEDTVYYRCECKGVFPRFSHAVISTFTARRGGDGHRVVSIPSIVAPYAGTMTAVFAWYPQRYEAKDGFRMGNYSILGYVGANVAREFLYSGRRSLLSRMQSQHGHGELSPGSKP
jgi:hypothetical protein